MEKLVDAYEAAGRPAEETPNNKVCGKGRKPLKAVAIRRLRG